MLSDYNTVFYSVAFLVPGFIINAALSFLVPRKFEQTQLTVIRILTLSIFNYALWSWLVYLIFNDQFFTGSQIRTAFAWSFIILFGPVLAALAWGAFLQSDIISKILDTMGLRSIYHIPTAWDSKFSALNKVLWVIVTLKDGSRVAGLFADASLASSDSQERDLFIQKVYWITEEEKWEPVANSDGILILGDQIRLIEFFDNTKGVPDE